MGRGPLTIMVVDDDVDFADMLAATLRAEGHDVHVAPTSTHAVALAGTVRFDCVLLDLNLGGDGDGFDVARNLRAGPLRATAVIIMLTGTPHAAPQDAADAVGVDLVLAKPVNLDLIDGLIRQLLSIRVRKVAPYIRPD